jgi:hypothetical protein
MICPRCGQTAVEELFDVTTFSDPEPRYLSNGLHCPDLDCLDGFGRNLVEPPTPAEVVEMANKSWLAHQRELTSG